MRKIWIRIDPFDKEMVKEALEGGADGVLIPPGYTRQVKELGKIETIAEDGDLKLGQDVVFFSIESGEQEKEILELSRQHRVILQTSDWTIIPLENLIAQGADVIAQVESLSDAHTAFGILEKGVKHILFIPDDPLSLKKALLDLRSSEMKIDLSIAEILEIKPLGMGDRVCVDTCSTMTIGQGILAGNASGALFLVHSESLENPYVAPRPFRVNAGPVHAYTRLSSGRTRYLSELSAGDHVLIVDWQGSTVPGIVGRIKIEKRPLMLVTARSGDNDISGIFQNAETIRLTSPEGRPLSVVSLKPGDQILVALEKGARHFGHRIDETITEQ